MSKASGKIVVITGCTRGLGHALTGYFVHDGAIVIGCGRTALTADPAPPQSFSIVDVSNDAHVSAWAKRALAEHGAPDLLINNAAVIAPNAPLWEVGAEAFRRVMDVNVTGTANVIRHFVPAMIARGKGVIVNFSSGWGRSTSPEVAPYCASKWAIEGLTQALAQELPPGLAAIALNPGIIDTEMLRSCFGSEAGHYPSPAQWVKAAGPFLLGLAAKDNGRALTVPGGS